MSMKRYIHAVLSVVLVASAAFGGVQTLNTGDSGAGASVYYSQTASSGNIHPDPTGAFYASVWCKPNTGSAWKNDGNSHIICSLQKLSTYTNYFRISKGNSGESNALYVGFKCNNVAATGEASPIALATWTAAWSDTGWNHIVYTQGPDPTNASKVRWACYINGTLVQAVATNVTPPQAFSINDMRWGMGNWGGDGPTIGVAGSMTFGEFAWGHRYVSSTEAAALYNGGTAANPIDVLGLSGVRSYTTFRDYADTDRMGLLKWTGASTTNVLAHPNTTNTWPDIYVPSRSASRYVEQLDTWLRQATTPHLWVFDPGSSQNVPDRFAPANYAAPSGTPTFGTIGILPADQRTCVTFDGTDDYFDTQTEGTFDYDTRTPSVDLTFGGVIQVDAGLANGTYPIFSKLGASTAFPGLELDVIKDANGYHLRGYVGVSESGTPDAVWVKTPDASLATGRPVAWFFRLDGAATFTNSNVWIGIDGVPQTLTTVNSADASIAGDTQNNNPLYIGRAVRGSTTYFKGRMASFWIAKELLGFSKLSALSTLALNDLPDLYIQDRQGTRFRPGDAGFKPYILIDTDSDDDRGDAMALEALAMYQDAGLCQVIGILSTARNGHADAAAIPGAIRKLRRLSAPIGTWQGTAIGSSDASDITAGAGSVLTNYVSLFSGVSTANASYPTTLAVAKTELAKYPDHSVIIITIGHADAVDELLTDGTYTSKIAGVVSMFGAYTPSTDGTLLHSDNFDGSGGDGEHNISFNPTAFSTLATSLNTAKIPWIIAGYDVANRSGSSQNNPLSGRAYTYLTNSVAKAAADAQGNTYDGRVWWDHQAVVMGVMGGIFKSRVPALGGFEWQGRGTLGVNTSSGTPYATYDAGYTRLLRSAQSGYVWTVFMDDGTLGTSPPYAGRNLCNYADRFITLAERDATYGILGDPRGGAGNNIWLAPRRNR